MDSSTAQISEKFAPIRKGLLEFAVLRVVAGEKLYVAEMLQRLASTEFATQEGTLYPLLSRLRREGLVDYEWRESETGPPRKYYLLTGAGEQALAGLQGYWQHLTETLNRIGK
ncbi:MAG TPA: PadR family transcriptional regulator [Steroidobacteraceae bacterium]|nr:PadR family transcriptional regulator [Steroidobacteraceae bacterium]